MLHLLPLFMSFHMIPWLLNSKEKPNQNEKAEIFNTPIWHGKARLRSLEFLAVVLICIKAGKNSPILSLFLKKLWIIVSSLITRGKKTISSQPVEVTNAILMELLIKPLLKLYWLNNFMFQLVSLSWWRKELPKNYEKMNKLHLQIHPITYGHHTFNFRMALDLW